MNFAKFGFAAILIAMAAPAAAQTTDELKARIAALEKENAKLHRELTSRHAPSVRPGPEPGGSRSPEAATTAAPADRRVAAAYAAAPPLPGSWTGFYVGGNFGLSVAKNASDSTLVRTFGPQSTRGIERLTSAHKVAPWGHKRELIGRSAGVSSSAWRATISGAMPAAKPA